MARLRMGTPQKGKKKGTGKLVMPWRSEARAASDKVRLLTPKKKNKRKNVLLTYILLKALSGQVTELSCPPPHELGTQFIELGRMEG